MATKSSSTTTDTYTDRKHKDDILLSTISAASSISSSLRSSLGPRGMDKLISTPPSSITITNDGATILRHLPLLHPSSHFLLHLSSAQDSAAGDGTTSVVLLASSLLSHSSYLLSLSLHPSLLSSSLYKTSLKSSEILSSIATPLPISHRESLLNSATTSLNTKLLSQYSSLLSPIAVDSLLSIPHPPNLKNIHIIQIPGSTVDESFLFHGLLFHSKLSSASPKLIRNAKIAVVQFHISPPKTDIEHSLVITDYTQMDRILKEERAYILKIVKKIKACNCNVLLIQKSILRDAVTDLSLHYLAKAKIMVLKDVERDEIEFITKTLNCTPISNIDHFKEEKLGEAELVEEVALQGGEKIVKIHGIKNMGGTATIVLRGSNKMVLEEAERSLHDALCVVRCLINERFLIAGGGAPEIELSRRLGLWAKELKGMESVCVKEFAEAMEIIPYTLAENAGLNPIEVVTELRNRHAKGEVNAGINVRKGRVTDILEENVVQPLLVTSSAVTLAIECVRMILKIDDIVTVR